MPSIVPKLPFLSDGTTLTPAAQPVPGQIELLYVGKQLENQNYLGCPPHQANSVGIISQFFQLKKNPHLVVFYPHNDHRGKLVKVQGDTVEHQGSGYSITNSINFREPPGRTWMLGYTDGIIVDLKAAPPRDRAPLTYVLALRTRDCVVVSGFDGQFAFSVHLSSQLLFGFVNPDQFTGSILKRLFTSGVNPRNSRVWLGPAIAGIRDQGSCLGCYEYSEDNIKQDGSRLVQCIQREYPIFEYPDFNIHSFYREREAGQPGGKLDFDWCLMVIGLLQLHGVPPEQIDTSANLCTRCHSDAWYSDRVLRHDQSPEGQDLYRQRVGNQNLMFVCAD